MVQQQPTIIQQPQPVIKYVDQYGNPVAPPTQQVIQPQPNIRYVDQYGNPVAPPTQQQQQPVIKYVDQNGNPVAPPKQPMVKYVDQNGNPVAPPTTTTTTTTAPGKATTPGTTATTDTPSQRQQKMGAAILSMLGCLLLFIGLCLNSLSHESDSLLGYTISTTCGFTSIRYNCDLCDTSESTTSYNDACDAQNDYWWYDDPDSSYCGTQAAGAISLVTMLIALILNIVGICYVQPWKPISPHCCKSGNPPRTNLALSILFSLISILAWIIGDDICTAELGLGGTHITQIIAMILNFIACALARK